MHVHEKGKMSFQATYEHLFSFCCHKNGLVSISKYLCCTENTFFFHTTFLEICIMLQEFIIVHSPIQETELN